MTSQEKIALLRILDANANRASEGLRVVEDFARFVLDDRFLAGECKMLRHSLSALVAELPSNLHSARDARADVGATLGTEAEYTRGSAAAVVAANWSRLEQSLRSLEEYGKVFASEWGARVETLRYKAYTLQRAFSTTHTSRERLVNARLYVLVNAGDSASYISGQVKMLLARGVPAIQLRDKELCDRDLLARARTLCDLCRGTQTLAIINDRPDIAALARADGVHIGQDEMSVKDARSIVGPDALVGVSTHTIAQARTAVLDGANYIGVGPTFRSSTKHFDEFPGLGFLTQVAAEISLPAFAIGGISQENIPQVLATGIRRVAVSGAIWQADRPEVAVGELVGTLNS